MTPAVRRVAACGLSPREERVVGIILSRVPSSQFRYVWSPLPHDEGCDILLIEPLAPGWQIALQNLRVHSPRVIAVHLADAHAPDRRGYSISRRALWSHLVCTLDDIVLSEANGTQGLLGGSSATPTRAAVAIPTPTASTQTPAPQLAQIRALVLDDSITVRNQIQAALIELGIRSEGVSNGSAALDLLERQTFDLLFLDVVMPGVDGYEVCRRVRRNPATRRLPIAMLTSRSSAFDRARGALAGCDLYLVKPIDVVAFHQAVNRIVAKLCKNDLAQAQRRGFIPAAGWPSNPAA